MYKRQNNNSNNKNFDDLRLAGPASRADIFAAYPLNPNRAQVIREAWIESLDQDQDGDGKDDDTDTAQLIELHPEIWSVRPRIDIIEKNVRWQKEYKKVRFEKALNRYEMKPGTEGRPWPQKGARAPRHAFISFI